MPRKTGDHFKPGDLVFAKMKGFPHWPARVCKSESGNKKRVPVFFFGTHQIGHLPPQNIVPFVGNKMKYGSSGVRIKGFSEGMWEIQNTPGVGSKPRSNTQTTPTKPGSSPNSAAAKPISTPKTPAKLTSLSKTTPTKQVTDEEVRTTHGKPAPAEGESKATVGRRRLHVKGNAAPIASAVRRASLRSAPEEMTPDSMQTSAVVTPKDVPGATVKRRGRKPAMRNALAETAVTATTTTTTTNPSKASETVSKKLVEDPNDRQPTAETILASPEKEKSTDNLTQAPDSRAMSQQAGSSSTSGHTEEATKPAATRRKVSKVDTEQQKKKKKPLAAADANTPVSKKPRAAKTKAETEPPSKSQEKKEEGTKEESLESQGVKKKMEEKEEGEEALKKMSPCVQEEKKEALVMEKSAPRRRGRKRKKEREEGEEEIQKKIKQDGGVEGKEEMVMMRTRRAEREEQKEEQNETKQRQEGRGRRGRRGRRPGNQRREWRRSIEEQQATEVTMRKKGRRGRKRKQKEVLEEEVVTKVREEEQKREEVSRAKKKKREDPAEDGKKEEKKGPETETEKNKESPPVDEERQRHLASKRESVLKSLRGLLKAGRGRRRREATMSLLKTRDRAQKKTSGAKPSDKKRVKQSNITTAIRKKVTEEKQAPKRLEEDKQKEEKKTDEGEMMEVKKDEQRTEPKKGKMPSDVKEKEGGPKEDNRMKAGKAEGKKDDEKKEEERTSNDAKQQKEEEKKNERKIIGKIVKASAGQKAKVQMKTIMGGLMKAEVEEEKKKNEERESKEKKVENSKEKTTESDTRDRGNMEEKRGERTTEVEKKSDKTKTTTDNKKDKLTKVDKDKKTRRNDEGEEKRLEKKDEGKLGNVVMREEKSGKPERESQKMEEPKAKQMVQTEAESEEKGAKMAKPVKKNTGEKKSDKTSTSSSEAPPEKSDSDGKDEEEVGARKKSDSSDGERTKQQRQRKSAAMTLTDSTLHRIHGDIRISLKTDNPDINRCLMALDQLSMVYVTSKHVQRHSELVVTLRKLRYYRANQTIMDKASMLYNRFKNAYLVGEGEEVVSAGFLHSLLEEKEREEAQRVERCKKRTMEAELLQEVKRRMGQVKGRKRADGGDQEETEGGAESSGQKEDRGGEATVDCS